MASSDLPHLYQPRDYQRPFWSHLLDQGGYRKRAALVWHRRAGKDMTAWNWMIFSAIALRAGTYFYFFPTYAQGKKDLWDAQNKDSVPFLDFVPKEYILGKNETEMQIKVRNRAGGESIIQIVGTDRYDSIRGSNPIGCVFSEYSYQDPGAAKVVQPILRENGGWAVFVFTPNGRNQAFKLHEEAQKDKDWYSSLLTIDNTHLFSKDDIAADVRMGIVDEDDVAREFYCSFTGSIQGAYYAKQIELAYADERIRRVPWDGTLPVETWWDLGIDDSMSIWFAQRTRGEIRLIDYEEHSGEGFPFYAKLLRDKPYHYSHHLMPHDISVREFGTCITRRETCAKLGIRPIRTAPKLQDLMEGIQAARIMFSQCYFDEVKCERGISALSSYKKQKDELRGVYSKHPVHDWASHGADAFRTGATASRAPESDAQPRQERADDNWSPF